MQLIKEINISFKTSRKSFTNLNNIKKYSLLLEEHFEKCTTKIMEVILSEGKGKDRCCHIAVKMNLYVHL